MAARDQVLGQLKPSNDPDHHQEDGKSAFGIAETKTSADHRESCKALQIDGSPRDGPKSNRRKDEDGNGQDKQPCDPPEEDVGCHAGGFNPCPGFVNVPSVLPRCRSDKTLWNSQRIMFSLRNGAFAECR
jgi:hypothetical protein